MISLPPINSTFDLNRSILQAREQANDLQRQLATGKKSLTYGGLGNERTLALSFRSEISQLEGYQTTIVNVQTRLDVMQLTLGRIRELASETKSDAFGGLFDPQAGDKTSLQISAEGRLSEMVALLNTQVGERRIFGGRATDKAPVVSPDIILNGGAGKAGFIQIANERELADLGTDGRGRLIASGPAGGNVNLAEDGAHPFGFKLNTVYSTLSGTTVASPSGSPANFDVTFSGSLPADGETLSLTLDLPDGTSTTIELIAKSGPTSDVNEFRIGADATETAGNFLVALENSLEKSAKTVLSAASRAQAGNEFFNFDASNPPKRVVGPSFGTATALQNATTSDTVFWYEGELASDPARQTAVARIDDTILVNYGARANEETFTAIIKQLAVIATDSFPENDANSQLRYEEIIKRANTELSFPPGSQSVDHIIAEFTVIQGTVGTTDERHTSSINLTEGFLSDIENTDPFEVSAQILSLQTRLEASLQVSASLGQISLINFI